MSGDRGSHRHRLHPKLRMIGNGSASVNVMRSDICSTVATSVRLAAEKVGVPDNVDVAQLRATFPMAPSAEQRERAPLPARRKLAEEPRADQVFVNVFIELQRESSPGVHLSDTMKRIRKTCAGVTAARHESAPRAPRERRNFLIATVPISSLAALARDPGIAFVHAAQPLTFHRPLDHAALDRPPAPRGVGNDALRKRHRDGAGVIIGIIDVGGFDFSHPDFVEDGKTRFLAIWDQGCSRRKPPERADGTPIFDYGSEITKALMDRALEEQARGGLPATLVERQSQRTEGSHGTHVASIAAGKSGVCPNADIAAVLIHVPTLADRRKQRRATFSDSTRIVDAVEYLVALAQREDKPISINISLGTNGGAHDGSSGTSRWLDALLATPGRAITVAAGNAGQEKAITQGDLGYIAGRIHSSGRIAASGLAVDLEWTVVGNGIEDISENELEIWYGAQDRVSVMLKPPGPEARWITVPPRRYIENLRLPSGTMVSIYNELYHPTSGSNYVALYLSPHYQSDSVRGVEAGLWKVRLVGDEIRDGRYNCWIERDDPVEIRALENVRLFRFPSFFSAASNVDSHSISSLACGYRVIAVANLDDARQRINISSSQGPTRDDRCKPDIAAAGTNIVAAKGFSEDGRLWTGKTGTSMASPYVAGVVALMLAANRHLTSAQCSGILQRTAHPLPGASFEWRNDAGFGVIDAAAAIADAVTFNERSAAKVAAA